MQENRLIDTKFKADFLIRFCLLIIIGSLFLGGILYLLWSRELGATYTQAISTLVSVKKIIIPVVVITVLLQAVILSVVTIFLTLFVSHRLAGPVYRLEKGLESIRNGDLTMKISLRRGDQIHGLARSFEEMFCSIQKKLKEIGGSICRIKEKNGALDKIIESETYSQDDIKSIVNTLNREAEYLAEKLKGFKVAE